MTSIDESLDVTSNGAPDSFARAETLERALRELAAEHELGRGSVVEELLAMLGALVTTPNTVFVDPPEYRRDLPGEALPIGTPASSTHGFFDVVRGRASRRDFGSAPIELARLMGVLHWTLGRRKDNVAYDFRDAPLRYVPSGGGLASTDAYVIANRVDGVEPGSYYFDYVRGLVPISPGLMVQRVADMNPAQGWVADAAAIVVFVANAERLAHKYGSMGFKLLLLDAGVAVGHAELVATALELRTSILGGLPPDKLARLLRIDGETRVPVASLVLGMNPAMDEVVVGLALGTPLIQALLMGVIGYPLARRRPGGMERFHRSGFQWWIVALLVVLASGAALASDTLALTSPAQHDPVTAARVLITIAVGLAVLLIIEVLGELWQAKSRSPAARAGRERYEKALPESIARTATGEGALVGFVALIEEAVYRGLALGSMLAITDSKPLAAGIVAIGFGAAHWYFGARQVLLKMLIGSVLCAVALSAGWAAAAATHVLFNFVLVAWAHRAKRA